METWAQLAITSIVTFGASSGLWAYIQHKDQRRNATSQLLMGLAYNRLVSLGVQYIKRGYISTDEYEEYEKYYYAPYRALGGNGTAERIFNRVTSLPFSSHSKYAEILDNSKTEEFINNVRVVTPPAEHADAE